MLSRYHDRPLKLRQHLPFAVDYRNASFNTSTDDPPSPSQQALYTKNIQTFNERLGYLSSVGTDPQEEALEKKLAGIKKKEQTADGDANKLNSQVQSLKDILETSAPIYKEEDIQGLFIKGTSVYDSEKKALLNTIDELVHE